MNSKELKQEIRASKVPQWKIADRLGVCEMTLIRWLRHEIGNDLTAKIRSIIKELKAGDKE